MAHAALPASQALVLGATGGIGGEVARQLRDAGWRVRALQRGLDSDVVERDGITWQRGDAMCREDVMRAARGCSVIVHAVNPPGYRRWSELVLPMIDNTIAAATAERATIVLPGAIYNYGPDAFPMLREDSAQHPTTRKGAIRVELERRLRSASEEKARVIIVRAADFFGPRAGSNWFSQGLVKPGKPVSVISLPGDPGVGHQWSYLPDVARTMVELLVRRESLEPFATFHTAGHWDADGTQIGTAIQLAVARHDADGQVTQKAAQKATQSAAAKKPPKLRAFPWWIVPLMAPFVTTMREVLEMRYLWRYPWRMDNSHLIAVLGAEPHTPLDEAVEATLVGLGCLPSGRRT